MIVTCPKCNLNYDDARRSTMCPHSPLMSDPDMDRKIAAIDLMNRARGKLVRFRHMGATESHRLLAVTWNGMVEVEGFGGEFAPHLFEVVEETIMADQQQAGETKISEVAAGAMAITTHYSNQPSAIKNIDNLFTYHAPKGDQQARYVVIRAAARALADIIVDMCPPSADTTAAIRLLREAVMTANQSIACGE